MTMATKITIYDIKYRTAETSPCFFKRKTLKHWGQTMKSFKVSKCEDGRYFISAPIIFDGKETGYTERYFNPMRNTLELR